MHFALGYCNIMIFYIVSFTSHIFRACTLFLHVLIFFSLEYHYEGWTPVRVVDLNFMLVFIFLDHETLVFTSRAFSRVLCPMKDSWWTPKLATPTLILLSFLSLIFILFVGRNFNSRDQMMPYNRGHCESVKRRKLN